VLVVGSSQIFLLIFLGYACCLFNISETVCLRNIVSKQMYIMHSGRNISKKYFYKPPTEAFTWLDLLLTTDVMYSSGNTVLYLTASMVVHVVCS